MMLYIALDTASSASFLLLVACLSNVQGQNSADILSARIWSSRRCPNCVPDVCPVTTHTSLVCCWDYQTPRQFRIVKQFGFEGTSSAICSEDSSSFTVG